MKYWFFLIFIIVTVKGTPLACQKDQQNEIYSKDCETQTKCENQCCPLGNYENIQISDRNNSLTYSYCYKAINYDLDFQTFQNHQILDAFQNYTTIYNKYLEAGSVQDNASCLSILRLFFCGIQFPRCDSTNGNQIGGSLPEQAQMCSFICDLLTVRCPLETQLYNQYCKNQNDQVCQYSYKIYISYIFLLFIVIFN